MKIKVCGLREPDNIRDVLDLNVDYVGFILAEQSKRYVGDTDLAAWIADNEERFGTTQRVGVFVNAGVDVLLNAVHDYRLDWVQLHGDESPGYCRELQLLWSVNTLRKASVAKAFSVDAGFDFAVTAAYADSCDLFIFDTGGHPQAGGTGKQWNWDRLAEYIGNVPFLLSGGIGPDDAHRLRTIDHPQLLGVDLNSRFETTPGVKDEGRLKAFIRELRGR